MAGFKTWISGEILSAADLNKLPQYNHVIKAANESVTSSTAMQDDDHLFLSVSANTDYLVEAFLLYTGISTGYLKIGWSGPASATFDWTPDSVTGGGTVGQVDRGGLTIADVGFAHVVNTTVKTVALPQGLLRVAGTAGTFRFRWAQANVQATATIVYANSYMRITRL